MINELDSDTPETTIWLQIGLRKLARNKAREWISKWEISKEMKRDV